jgi:1-aminocyclopropane-1-carboxylate deaminase
LEQLHIDFPNAFIIPEGGANFYGLTGCQEIWRELPLNFSDVVLAAGTGTTAAGLLSGMPESMHMHVFSALKGDFMKNEIIKKINYSFHNQEFTDICASRITVYEENVFGGYGKCNNELLDFINDVNAKYNLPLDQVYTAKAFFRLQRMLDAKLFDVNSRILFIHTGGLQGNTAS